MSDDNGNTPVDNDTDDLEVFEADFFGTTPSTEDVVQEEDAETLEVDDQAGEDDDPPATEDDEESEADDEESEEEEEAEEEEEPEEVAPPKKKSAKERINELTAKAREAERERDALRREFEALKASVTKEDTKEETPKTLREQLPADAPNPDAKDDDGEAVYPLGEFDPAFIRDLTKFTIAQETKAAKEAAELEARNKEIEEVRNAIANQYAENLTKLEETAPDARESIKGLTEVFQDIDPQYGDYLATTVMSSEYGAQIMYYLSQNIGEAQKIVASGPAAATLALGRLEARFIGEPQEKKRNKVSKAPPPPSGVTRGSNGRIAVKPDTDNLDAFEREFFK